MPRRQPKRCRPARWQPRSSATRTGCGCRCRCSTRTTTSIGWSKCWAAVGRRRHNERVNLCGTPICPTTSEGRDQRMTIQNTRREILRGSLAVAGLSALGVPDWVLPALAQGETVVKFTDIPDNQRWETAPDRRTFDLRTIDGPFVAKDKFATTQHYGHPDVEPATLKLKVWGLVDRP